MLFFAAVYSPVEQRRLIEESLVMIQFNHMNVMKLIGVSPHDRLSLYIVMPYMIHGSLLSYLRKNRANLTLLNNDDITLVSIGTYSQLSHLLYVFISPVE